MQTLTPYESQWFNFSLSYTNVNHYKINIPITSIDITGSLDIADTLIYYIKRASDSLNGPYTATVQLPKGTFLLLKEIIIPSGIHVKGEGAGVTIINCKAGEGKHCFKLSPQNTNAIAKLPISQSLEKGQDSFLVDIDTLDSVSGSFFGAIVNYNDSDLVTSS